uniref:TSA: Wollemia nobilis Ref_Wollemi_Transcript_12091_826 transcribed RNA sequence n=1 Tax=Wollemia nobilis TaxID=56998 RepID=A0A0C9RLQ4_9CONI
MADNSYYHHRPASGGGGGSPVSSPPSDDSGGGTSGAAPGNNGYIREQDRLLPIANVGRIMKRALPANAKISKEAKETVQECVSEFISFITGEASDKCQREKRKTINGDDLLWAMGTLGFENYVDPLKLYLQKYRELEGEKTTMAKQSGDQSPSKDASASGSASGSAPTAAGNGSNVAGGASKYAGSFYPQQAYGVAAAPQMYGGQQHQQQMLGHPYMHVSKTATGNSGDHHQPRGQW